MGFHDQIRKKRKMQFGFVLKTLIGVFLIMILRAAENEASPTDHDEILDLRKMIVEELRVQFPRGWDPSFMMELGETVKCNLELHQDVLQVDSVTNGSFPNFAVLYDRAPPQLPFQGVTSYLIALQLSSDSDDCALLIVHVRRQISIRSKPWILEWDHVKMKTDQLDHFSLSLLPLARSAVWLKFVGFSFFYKSSDEITFNKTRSTLFERNAKIPWMGHGDCDYDAQTLPTLKTPRNGYELSVYYLSLYRLDCYPILVAEVEALVLERLITFTQGGRINTNSTHSVLKRKLHIPDVWEKALTAVMLSSFSHAYQSQLLQHRLFRNFTTELGCHSPALQLVYSCTYETLVSLVSHVIRRFQDEQFKVHSLKIVNRVLNILRSFQNVVIDVVNDIDKYCYQENCDLLRKMHINEQCLVEVLQKYITKDILVILEGDFDYNFMLSYNAYFHSFKHLEKSCCVI